MRNEGLSQIVWWQEGDGEEDRVFGGEEGGENLRGGGQVEGDGLLQGVFFLVPPTKFKYRNPL